MATEPMEWACERCLAVYGEYVNGCPKCWSDGEIRAKVRLFTARELIDAATSQESTNAH